MMKMETHIHARTSERYVQKEITARDEQIKSKIVFFFFVYALGVAACTVRAQDARARESRRMDARDVYCLQKKKDQQTRSRSDLISLSLPLSFHFILLSVISCHLFLTVKNLITEIATCAEVCMAVRRRTTELLLSSLQARKIKNVSHLVRAVF